MDTSHHEKTDWYIFPVTSELQLIGFFCTWKVNYSKLKKALEKNEPYPMLDTLDVSFEKKCHIQFDIVPTTEKDSLTGIRLLFRFQESTVRKITTVFRCSLANSAGEPVRTTDYSKDNLTAIDENSVAYLMTNFSLDKFNVLDSDDCLCLVLEGAVLDESLPVVNKEINITFKLDKRLKTLKSELEAKSSDNANVCLRVHSDKTIYNVHKSRIDGFSDYVDEKLTTGKPNNEGLFVIDFYDEESSNIAEFVHYMYTGSVTKYFRHMKDKLLVAANKYNFTALKKLCEKKLIADLNASNAVQYFSLAVENKAELLRNESGKFIKANDDVVTDTKDYTESVEKYREAKETLLTSKTNFRDDHFSS